MAKERRDSKNRILGKGEYQKNDGRYMYRYTDADGSTRFVYSWTLTQSDRVPRGKPPGKCLRELEKEIALNVNDGIKHHESQKHTLNDIFDARMSSMRHIKRTTRCNYTYMYEAYVRDNIGSMRVADIKYSTIKKFYEGLLCDKGFAPTTLKTLNAVINPLFSIALRDGLIRMNPSRGVVAEIIKSEGATYERQHPLTTTQQKAFIGFVREHGIYRKWLNVFTVLLGTGMRIGELIGLTYENCDFENGVIHIDHSLVFAKDDDGGPSRYFISTPKTKAGIRDIPMFTAVREALLDEWEKRRVNGQTSFEIDGCSGFIFLNKLGRTLQPQSINDAIERIVTEYNETEEYMAKAECRSPELLPRFTAHNLRHTFCTRLCESETNIKVIQEIMGHATISITMDIYNEASMDLKRSALSDIESRVMIG